MYSRPYSTARKPRQLLLQRKLYVKAGMSWHRKNEPYEDKKPPASPDVGGKNEYERNEVVRNTEYVLFISYFPSIVNVDVSNIGNVMTCHLLNGKLMTKRLIRVTRHQIS